jgi:dihydropyrimidinase
MDALQMWDNKVVRAHCDYSYHMAVTWWGEQVFDEMAAVVDRGHHQLQALPGLQGRADGE